MTLTPAPAEELVVVRTKVPGGPWFVELKEPHGEPFLLGPYDNRGVARDEAQRLRRFMAAVLADARQGAGPG